MGKFPSSANNCYKPKQNKFVKRLRLGLRYLQKHEFKHIFQDLINLQLTFLLMKGTTSSILQAELIKIR